jgi:phage replication O-like protein O
MPGQVRVDNELWDAWCRVGSAKERVFKAIVRLTWGWNLESRVIKQTDIMELTNLTNRSQISKLTAKLVEERMLVKMCAGGKPTEYAPNREYRDWNPVSDLGSTSNSDSTSESGTSSKSGNRTSSNLGNGTSSNLGNSHEGDLHDNHDNSHGENHVDLSEQSTSVEEKLASPKPIGGRGDSPIIDLLDRLIPVDTDQARARAPDNARRQAVQNLCSRYPANRVQHYLEIIETMPDIRGGRIVSYLTECLINDNGTEAPNGGGSFAGKKKHSRVDSI